jgi:hypothetical protein
VNTHKISVTVEKDSIKVTPDTLVMTMNDEVHWAGANARKFSIEFDGEGPFGSRKLAHALTGNKHKPRAKGRFKYTVISDENPGLKLDPVVVVDPPPSGTQDPPPPPTGEE